MERYCSTGHRLQRAVTPTEEEEEVEKEEVSLKVLLPSSGEYMTKIKRIASSNVGPKSYIRQ